MARPQSKAAKGYYKTPPHLIPLIAKYLQVKEKGENYRIFDPCCGTGEAIFLLAENLKLPTSCLYGNELDGERFEEAKKCIPNVLYGDAITDLRISPCSFSLLFENPPYDNEGEGIRTEMKFLQAHYRFLAQNGILVLIVPEYVLHREDFIKALPVWFKDIRIFRFPEQDFKKYCQVVLFGRKQRAILKREEENYKKQLESPKTLGDECDIVYELPECIRNFKFESNNVTESQVQELLNNKFLQYALNLGLEDNNERERKIVSLMKLRTGHQCLLLASGGIDGIYKDPQNGDLLVIKGITENKINTIIKKEGNEEIIIHVTKPVPRIKCFNLTQSRQLDDIVTYEIK